MLYLKLNRNSYTLFPYLKYLTFSNESPIFFRSSGEKKKHTTHPTTNWGVSQAVDPSSPGAGTRFLAMVPAMERGGRAHRCEFHRRILTLTMDVYVFWLKKIWDFSELQLGDVKISWFIVVMWFIHVYPWFSTWKQWLVAGIIWDPTLTKTHISFQMNKTLTLT